MYDLGLLQQLIPEFAGTDQLLQNPRYHPEGDVLTHVCEVVDRAPPAYRWHALLHDIGKGPTARLKPEGHYSFHGHEYAGAERISRIAKDLKLPNALRDALVITTELHMVPAFTPPTAAAIRRFQARAGEHLRALEAVCRADAGYSHSEYGLRPPPTGYSHSEGQRPPPRADRRPGSAWKFFEPQKVPIKPVLQGRDLIERGHSPGRTFSQMLKAAFEYQLENGVTDKELLYAVALEAEGGKQEAEGKR
jgi:poly(A) polymerase/tRNA nucleotidyltransferase (CCA-adding enzyme)